MKQRLDQYLADEGVFESRARAKAAVLEGLISVDGNSNVKPGTQVSGCEQIVVSGNEEQYVSRGGTKLARALEDFELDVAGKVIVDIGSSTGGFTDCLLARGASRVIALDVGKGQLHWKLRNDSRVTVIEGYNAKNLQPGDLPEQPSIAVVDVSFISLRKILEPVFGVLATDGSVVALVKPQFEAGRKQVEKGGVVRDPEVHIRVLQDLVGWLRQRELSATQVSASTLRGPKGNIEFFLHIIRGGGGVGDEELGKEVRRVHGQGVQQGPDHSQRA
jgi:23S rRNA (cytidine1920-2'-O)/16S rRNA (cytidine1409-2'-O)-methyltransferase